MSSLSNAVLDIQSILAAAACIDEFRVSHVEGDDDTADRVRVAYTVAGKNGIGESELLMSRIEDRFNLVMVGSGPTGDGFYIVWTAAA